MIRVLLVLILATSVVYSAGTASYEFLRVGVGERACSMGEAFSGVADDATAIFWNPAGATQLAKKELTVGHTAYVAEIKLANAGYMVPAGRFVIGIGLQSLYDEQWRRDYDGNVLGTFSNNETSLGVMVGYKVRSDLSIGGTIKALNSQLDTERSSAIGIDIGAMYNVGGINFGLVVRNLGTNITYGEGTGALPTDVRIGVGYAGIAGGKGLISSDINIPVYGRKSLMVGGEYNIYKTLYIRGGYKLRDGGSELGALDGLNAGVGFSVRKVTINYGMAPFGEFAMTHRISLNTRF